jgi:hypothetical protein
MNVKQLKQCLNNVDDKLDVMMPNDEFNTFYHITNTQIETLQITDGMFSDNTEWVKNDIPTHDKQIIKIIQQKQALILKP